MTCSYGAFRGFTPRRGSVTFHSSAVKGRPICIRAGRQERAHDPCACERGCRVLARRGADRGTARARVVELETEARLVRLESLCKPGGVGPQRSRGACRPHRPVSCNGGSVPTFCLRAVRTLFVQRAALCTSSQSQTRLLDRHSIFLPPQLPAQDADGELYAGEPRSPALLCSMLCQCREASPIGAACCVLPHAPPLRIASPALPFRKVGLACLSAFP